MIWKIVVGSGTHVALEIRDDERLSVAYAVYDLLTHQEQVIAHERLDWWFTVIRVNKQGLVFRKYETDNNPFHEQSTFYSFAHQSLSDIHESTEPACHPGYGFPTAYLPKQAYYEDLQAFLRDKGIEPTGLIEYIERDGTMVITYQKENEALYEKYLVVFTEDGEIVFHEKIDADMKGHSLRSFITFFNFIIFVKHRHEFLLYRL